MVKLIIGILILVNISFIEAIYAQAPEQYCPLPNVPTPPIPGCFQYPRFTCTCTLSRSGYQPPLLVLAPNQQDAVESARVQMMCFSNLGYSTAVVNCSQE
jgi:hypothetical protein